MLGPVRDGVGESLFWNTGDLPTASALCRDDGAMLVVRTDIRGQNENWFAG